MVLAPNPETQSQFIYKNIDYNTEEKDRKK